MKATVLLYILNEAGHVVSIPVPLGYFGTEQRAQEFIETVLVSFPQHRHPEDIPVNTEKEKEKP